MKALIIYYTMGGRTKKVANAIASALSNYEVSFNAFELKGKYFEKIKVMDKFEHGDFSDIENNLASLDARDYDLVIFGMPTYGNFPPKTFNEIVSRIKNLHGKRTGVFVTARFTGEKSLETMKTKVIEKGAQVVGSRKFRRFLWINKHDAMEFGRFLSETHN